MLVLSDMHVGSNAHPINTFMDFSLSSSGEHNSEGTLAITPCKFTGQNLGVEGEKSY